MAHLIDKDALVAEINRLIAELVEEGEGTMFERGRISAFEDTKLFLDILEVKEMDLDTDFGICWGEYCDCGGNINDYEVAKHFFELGMAVSSKAQKGE